MNLSREQRTEQEKHNSEVKTNALRIYNSGITNISNITRRLMADGHEIWGRNTFHNFRQVVAKIVKEDKLRDENPSLFDECNSIGIDASTVKHAWYKGKHWSINFRPDEIGPSFDDMYQDHIKSIEEHTFDYKKIVRDKIKDPHLLVIDPADVHIGKYANKFGTGQDYNTEIAVSRVMEGIDKILQYSSSFEIDKILFVGGNDILHTDNNRRQTTKGTPQDTENMWYDNYRAAKNLYIACLEKLIKVADVHYVFNPSNHDFMSGFFLSDMIESWFRDCENITFDVDLTDRKYFLYGKNLIGTSHGDGAKQQNLGSLMSVEAKDKWAQARHTYFYVHHIHHKTSKDYINVTVESMRSPSSSDYWHHKMGYKSPEGVEGFLHHPENGQVARFSCIFDEEC
tara:strand:- start:9563 stop:10756 length:1194 start_codon:yes stop_codon:yes gene_type:complete